MHKNACIHYSEEHSRFQFLTSTELIKQQKGISYIKQHPFDIRCLISITLVINFH